MEDITNSVFTEIEIKARPEEVWSVLTDWKKLNEWSSSFVGISVDKMVIGERFMVYFKNPLNGEIIEFERMCTAYEERKKFSWSGEFISGVTDNHIHILEPTENGTTLFKQEDGIHGKHSKLLNLLGKKHMKSMYEKFDRQLKKRVESIYNNKKS
jgi:hypothetical protein